MSQKNLNTDKDFEFLQLLTKCRQQNYDELKQECLRKGILYKDDFFPLSSTAYYLKNSKAKNTKKIEWLRPHKIMSGCESSQPVFLQSTISLFACKSTNQKKTFESNKFKSFKYQLNIIKGNGSQNFVSALSILYRNNRILAHVVPSKQTFDAADYAGIFHFFIWQYGEWYDIVVDDRLPTINGKLIHVHTFQNLEFWPSLLEKAFAKLNGSYQSLHGCSLSEFLEDMTGGLCESINSDMSDNLNEGLFKILSKSVELNSHIIARISEKEEYLKRSQQDSKSSDCVSKQQLRNGLIICQSYIVLDTKVFDHFGPDKVVYLIKMCNPWKKINNLSQQFSISKSKSCLSKDPSLFSGNWLGSWSEDSDEWIRLSDTVKVNYGLIVNHDNEFWMPMESFVENFTNLDICHTSGNFTFCQKEAVKAWNQLTLDGYWITGVTAGGCYNQDTFHTNPIYLIPIREGKAEKTHQMLNSKSRSKDAPAPTYTILIGLMQKYRNSKRLTGLYDLKIGFHLFKMEKEDWNYVQEFIYDDDIEFPMRYNKIKYEQKIFTVIMKPEYFHTRKGEHAIQFFTNIRQVTARYKLSEGNYLMIPSTYRPNCDGNFLLRFYSEIPFDFSNNEIMDLLPPNVEKKHISKTYFLNRMFSRPIEKIGSNEENFDVEKLEVLLSSVTTFKRNIFNLDQCLTLLALYDLEYNGNLSYVQQQQLYIDIDECYQLFLKHDKAGSWTISCSELKSALEEIGINVNQRVVKMLVNRYGNSRKIVVKGTPLREIKFPNFAICLLKLRKSLIFWDVKFRSQTLLVSQFDSNLESSNQSDPRCIVDSNIFNLTLLEFVQQIIYS